MKQAGSGRWVILAAIVVGAFGLLWVPQASAEPTSASGTSAVTTPSGRVRVSVTRVRATGPAEAGAGATVDPQLEKLQIARLRLGYAKYAQDQVIEKTLAWGETLSVPVDASRGASAGRYEIVAVRPGAQPGRLVLRVKEIAPAASEPCLELETEIQASRLNLWFCDATIEGGTMLFFVRAEIAGE